MTVDALADVEEVLSASGLLDLPAAVAVASPRTGEESWASGDLLPGSPMSVERPLYAASVTKQVIGVLAAREVLAGRLDPDASITDHVEGLPAWAGGVRVRHLVHHTSGLPSTGRLAAAVGVGSESGLDDELVLEGLRRSRELDRAPGTAFAYSGTGYVCLARVVRAVCGSDLGGLARETLFAPLGMGSSHLGGPPDVVLPGLAPPPRTVGDGGLWTSARDLLRWLRALDDQRLGGALTDLVQTPGHLDDGTPLDYAWGVTARPDPRGTVFTHGGNWPGWAAKTVRQPATGTAVVVLARSDDVALVSDSAVALHRRLGAGTEAS